MKTILLAPLLAPAALAALAGSASAHATWIAWRGDAYAVVHGEGAAEEAYAPEAVTAPRAFGADGAEHSVTAAPAGGARVWPEE